MTLQQPAFNVNNDTFFVFLKTKPVYRIFSTPYESQPLNTEYPPWKNIQKPSEPKQHHEMSLSGRKTKAPSENRTKHSSRQLLRVRHRTPQCAAIIIPRDTEKASI